MIKMPKQWVTAGAPKKVEGRISMDEQTIGKGNCPSCKTQMKGPVFCSGLPMRMCWSCRIAMPYEDQEHKEHAEGHKPFEHNPVPAFL